VRKLAILRASDDLASGFLKFLIQIGEIYYLLATEVIEIIWEEKENNILSFEISKGNFLESIVVGHSAKHWSRSSYERKRLIHERS